MTIYFYRKPVIWLIMIFVLTPSWLTADAGSRPNIVWIFSDDHSYQTIGAYGGRLESLNPTPHIDRLAREGMVFERAYVANSICAPSRATLLTGKMSHLCNKFTNRGGFDQSQQTFPKLLQKSGYQTAMIGKIHLDGKMQGFDYWEVLPGQGKYNDSTFITDEGEKKYPGSYATDIITDKSLEWLRENRNTNKPFMLMIHHKAPHRPWIPKPEHMDKYQNDTIPEPSNLFDDYATRGTAAPDQKMSIDINMSLPRDLKVVQERNGLTGQYAHRNKYYAKNEPTGRDLVKWKYQIYMKDYLRCIWSLDENIGRVLDYLKESGLDKNTVVMYSSDQGFYMGEHGWFDKRFMYEESFRTPLIVRWPGATEPGTRNEALVQNIDFAQTFLDIAGAPIAASQRERPVLPPLRGDRAECGKGKGREYNVEKENSTELHSCQPLEDGKFLILECSEDRLFEIDRAGKIHNEIKLDGKNRGPHNRYGVARKTPEDTYIVPYVTESKVVEFSLGGKIIREIKIPDLEKSYIWYAERLANGNTLVSTGKDLRVLEIDPNGKTVWELRESDLPGIQLFCLMGVQRLPNGNTIVCNGDFHIQELPRGEVMMLEVTPDKKIAWKLTRTEMSKTLPPEDQNGTAVYRTSQARLINSATFSRQTAGPKPEISSAKPADQKKIKKTADKQTAATRSGMDPKKFTKMDANKDGQVSREEYVAAFAEGFERKDKDKDEVLTPTEHRHAGSFKYGDVDHNGKLTRDEYLNFFGQQFDRIHDTNKDGVLNDANAELATMDSAHAEANTGKPNFVLFIADDVSAEDLGCYAHPSIKTPNHWCPV